MSVTQEFGKASIIALAAVGALGVGGYAAYRYLSNRPGEAAIQFIPADADWVMTLDLKPSERQLATFQSISEALESKGIAQKADDWMKDLFSDEPWAEGVRQQLDRSFAVANWQDESAPTPNATGRTLIFLSVKDPGAVQNELAKSKKAGPDGTIQIEKDTVAFVFENYLVVSHGPSSNVAQTLADVREGKQPSIDESAEFAAARRTLPDDANLMVFGSPRAAKMIADQSKSQVGISPAAGASWFAVGATLTADGIQLDCHSPFDASKLGQWAQLSGAKPIDEAALATAPKGALGYWAVSQPGLAGETLEASILDATPAEGVPPAKESLEQFEKETGLSLEDDILPALKGEAVVAAYQAEPSSGRPVELLASVTATNGATPQKLAQKLREVFERESAKSNRPLEVRSESFEGATIWTFGKVEDGDFPIEPCYAETERGVLIATSPDFLKSAWTQTKAGQSLADDSRFSLNSGYFVVDPQAVFALDVKRTLDAFRTQIEPTLGKDGMAWAELVAMATSAPLTGSYRFDGKVFVAKGLLPVDIAGVIRAMGDEIVGRPEPSSTDDVSTNPMFQPSEASPESQIK